MVRIGDVARAAGVSTATVSRVLNGARVRPEMAEAVRRAADDLHYVPDVTARSLRRGASDVVALIVPDIENPFFTALARGVEDVLQEAGLSVVLCNSDERPGKEGAYLEIARRSNMAGVIIAAADGSPDLAALLERGRAVVAVDRPVAADVDTVLFDNVALGRSATQHLIDARRTRIACVTGSASTSTAVDRARGWRDALAAAGLPVDERLLVHARFTVDGGLRAWQALAAGDPAPDGVVAMNNLVGVGVLRGLGERRPPADVRAVVVGDLPFSTHPEQGTLVLPLHPRRMGTRAAAMLVERIGGATPSARHVVLAPSPEA